MRPHTLLATALLCLSSTSAYAWPFYSESVPSAASPSAGASDSKPAEKKAFNPKRAEKKKPHAKSESRRAAAKPAKGKHSGHYKSVAHDMHKAMDITYTGDADIDFARGMVPHHQGAVDMIEVLRKNGKNEELREMAEFMAKWQQVEIEIMNKWLAARDNKNLPPVENEAVAAYKEAMEKMHHAMAEKPSGCADRDFVLGMIPHHQGAIDMAWVQLKYGRDAQLKEIANDIIRSQQQEIAKMQEWLERHPVPEAKEEKQSKKKKK